MHQCLDRLGESVSNDRRTRLLHTVQKAGDWAGPQPTQASPRCTKCNSPPINRQRNSHRMYNGPLLCGFNVPMKGLLTYNTDDGHLPPKTFASNRSRTLYNGLQYDTILCI